MKMEETIQIYEEQTGKKVPATVANMAKRIDLMGAKYEHMGREDAKKKLQDISECSFRKTVKRALADDHQMAMFLAEYLHRCYMSGYRNQKEVKQDAVGNICKRPRPYGIDQ